MGVHFVDGGRLDGTFILVEGNVDGLYIYTRFQTVETLVPAFRDAGLVSRLVKHALVRDFAPRFPILSWPCDR